MNLDIRQANGLLVAHHPHWTHVPRGVGRQGPGGSCPTAQPAQRIQPAIDRGRPPAGRDHMLPVGDQIVLGKRLDGERGILDASVPGQEMVQIVTVTAKVAGARSSFARLARNAAIQSDSSALAADVCIARKVIPRVSTPVYCVQYTSVNAYLACNTDCMP